MRSCVASDPEKLGEPPRSVLHKARADLEGRVRATLTAHRRQLEALAQMLLREETVERGALVQLLVESAEVRPSAIAVG